MSHPYASESIWCNKYRADEAECHWQEHLANQRCNSSGSNVTAHSATAPAAKPCAKVTPTSSLVDEIARTREHIIHSLQSSNVSTPAGCADVQISVRVATLEKENQQLKSNVTDLQALVKKLEARIGALEITCKPVDSKPAVNHVAPVSKPVPEKKDRKDTENDDDDVDLFGSDEDEEANELREKRLQEYAAKKSKKPQVVAKSSIILDVKPWDDETDMGAMEKEVRKIVMDGLLWGASKLVPLAYGIQKLQICCVVEDEKVSIEELQEKIEAVEELVQSVDIAAFNKI